MSNQSKTAPRLNVTHYAAAGALLIGAYFIGTQQLMEPEANATSGDPYNAPAPVTVVQNLTPPTAVLPDAKSFAVVGAADGKYYVVRPDGCAIPVYGDRRHDLYWYDPGAIFPPQPSR